MLSVTSQQVVRTLSRSLTTRPKGIGIDDCRHDDVYLYTGEDHHVITCNQCGCWWRCYMDFADAWSFFTRYARGDGSSPATVGISCSPKAWPTKGGEKEAAK